MVQVAVFVSVLTHCWMSIALADLSTLINGQNIKVTYRDPELFINMIGIYSRYLIKVLLNISSILDMTCAGGEFQILLCALHITAFSF